jgi:hypothetical protein
MNEFLSAMDMNVHLSFFIPRLRTKTHETRKFREAKDECLQIVTSRFIVVVVLEKLYYHFSFLLFLSLRIRKYNMGG